MISPYLITVAAGWIVAQGSKYIVALARGRRFDHVRQLYLSGNMPSAHSASVMGLATIIGLSKGFESAIFALALLFAAITMYDAMMVRRSSGEQGVAIQGLIKELKSKVALPRAAKGHTPLEVACGGLLGIVIGTVVFITTN